MGSDGFWFSDKKRKEEEEAEEGPAVVVVVPHVFFFLSWQNKNKITKQIYKLSISFLFFVLFCFLFGSNQFLISKLFFPVWYTCEYCCW